MMTETQKEKLVSLARELVGKPYQYGAKPEDAPNVFDCSSFTQYLFGKIGIELPRSSILQAGDQKGRGVEPKPDFSNLEPGDLLFSRGAVGHYRDELFGGEPVDIGHVTIYLGTGRIVHAREKLGGVKEQPIAELHAEPKYQIVLVKRF